MQLPRIYLQRQQPALTIERAVDEFQVMLESRIAKKPADMLPLVVDLDGVLIRSNMLAEMVFGFVGRFPFEVSKLPIWLWSGKSVFKRRLAELSDIDVATLPYDASVLCRIRQAREQGRQVYLASACDERLVQAVADHLGGFDGWFASDEATDLSAGARDAKLVDAFGADGFDYIGNDRARVAAAKNAGATIAVDAPPPRAWRR